MQPIVVGNRAGFYNTTSFIFFADAASRGYLIRGDAPLGQSSKMACVDSVYRNVRLNDVSKPGVPSWALMPGVKTEVAEGACRRDHLGYQEKCGDHNASLNALNGNGRRVMLVATGTAINPRDHSIRPNQLVVLTLQPETQTGLVMAATPEGANYMLSAYMDGAFTQFGSAVLNRGE